MPSPIHTTIVDLLEAHPEVLSYLLGLQGSAPADPLVPANGTTSATFTIERRVDSAFLLGSSDNPGGFVLVEVQLGRDRDKVFAWALYVELARSRYGCEEKRAMKHPEFRSKFFRDLAAKFTAEGVAKGAAEGRAEAILEIFAARGLPVSESIRARVLGCTDIETLQHWQVRALVASSAAAAVRENPPSKAAPPPQTPRKSGGRSTARSTKSAGGKRAESAKQPA